MKKLLYIIVNSKPEEISASRTVGRAFVNRFLELHNDNDKQRGMVYIQSSGGEIPWLLRMVMNKGLNYVEDIIKTLGIKRFEELLVDGTGFTEEEKSAAVTKAVGKIDNIIGEVWRE